MMKTHNDIVDNLFEQLEYLNNLPDFNESSTVLYIAEAIQTIKSLRVTCAQYESALEQLRTKAAQVNHNIKC